MLKRINSSNGQIKMRKLGSFLLLFGMAFFCLKFSLGYFIDGQFRNIEFVAFGLNFVLRTSDFLLVVLDLIVIKTLVSFD